ncbi:hypothetical protein OG787_12230 [Streptomyces sp. NBC_00075]|uniref:hypothetical protein n=1 Tax=Streptomyces sp. NBC_00075 TaxID=2975641 RepID=UPI003244187F
MSEPVSRASGVRPVDLAKALAERALPSVTVYNRLEGRPRTRSFDRALRAEVRDALWMLTRQWQVAEFAADDAGSPITTTVHVERSGLTEFGARDFPTEPLGDDPLPLEARVERRPVVLSLDGDPLSLDLRLAMGRRWLKLLADPASGLSDDHRDRFRAAYPFTAPDPTDADDAARVAHLSVWQSYAAVAGRAMDGGRLYERLTARPPGRCHDGIPGVAEVDKPVLDGLAQRFVAWFEHLVLPATDAERDCWDPQRLEYRFRATAPAGPGPRRYTADDYRGGGLDWWALDLETAAAPAPPGAVDPPAVTASTATMVPSPVGFEGAPATRWWQFEDRRINLGAIDAATTDLATLLFVEFALIYANDWFLVPVSVPTGSVVQARGVSVTTVFGERFWITPAGSGADDTWQRWSMFSTSLVGAGPADSSLLLPPAAAKVQESEAVEQVALVRDEMANMVWGVENVIPSGVGGGMPGPLAAAETEAFHQRLAAGTALPPAPPEPRVAAVRYRTMGSVPEHWIPFVPVHVNGDNRQIQLQRAGLPRTVPGAAESAPVPVEPRTALLRVGKDAVPQLPYLLHEEEVPRAGTVLRQSYRRTRAFGGRPVVWYAAHRGTGRGEGSSGLVFDQLIDIPEE